MLELLSAYLIFAFVCESVYTWIHPEMHFMHLFLQPGLTMVVGPPGTGKTDVAVQIISNLYHNFPDQRTLIVTHSNQVGTNHV